MALDRDDYHARAAALQVRMAHAGLDAALLTDEANIAYFAGYLPEHFFLTRSRMLALVIPAIGEPIAVAPASHVRDVEEQTGLARIVAYHGLRRAPIEEIVAVLEGLGARRVGLELGFEQRVNMTALDLDRLRQRLNGAVADISDAVWGLRQVKSPAEVGLIEQACGIGAAALKRSLPRVRAGVTERDLAAWIVAEVALLGGRTAALMITSGPGGAHRGNGAPRDRALASGDVVFVDLCVRRAGYHSDFNRMLVVGRPADDQAALQRRVREVTEGAARLLVPGVLVAEVYARVLDDCRAAGLELEPPGRIGHGLGLGVTEPPHVAPDDPTRLTEGMVVTIEPTVERPDGLYCAEVVYVVTASGSRSLSGAGSSLYVV